jgi:hypothetical protein
MAVIAFHAAVVGVLLEASRYQVFPPSPDFIELLILPSSAPPKAHRRAVLVGPPARHLSPLPADASTIVVPLPKSPTHDAQRQDIDWGEEAHRAAETAAIDEPAFGPATRHNPVPSSRSGLTAPPHHAGEQFKLDTGEWVVWISDYCYQTSEWAPTPGGPTGPALPNTNCLLPSETPSGDLFKDLRE